MGKSEDAVNYEMKLYRKLIEDLYKIQNREIYNKPSIIHEKIDVMRLKLEGYFQGLKEAKENGFVQIVGFDEDLLTDDISLSEAKVEVTQDAIEPNPPKMIGRQ